MSVKINTELNSVDMYILQQSYQTERLQQEVMELNDRIRNLEIAIANFNSEFSDAAERHQDIQTLSVSMLKLAEVYIQSPQKKN